jgi:glucosamine--fructose-6-phosphate aminotransferase (isomerizing)
MLQALSQAESYKKVAHGIKHASDTLFLGRGTSYALALEGALKLKELSYIHAEGYSAGEMKHGPIALIDNKMPVMVVAPYDTLFEKTASNIEETLARHGIVTLFSDNTGCQHFSHKNITTVELPQTSLLTAPMVYSIPVQMLAYYAAVLRDTDVDQPRNLAKSVTIE